MLDLQGLTLANRARTPAESVAPELFPDHAWVPALGFQGVVLVDLCNNNNAVLRSAQEWGADYLDFEYSQENRAIASKSILGNANQLTLFSVFSRESYGNSSNAESHIISQFNYEAGRASYSLLGNAYSSFDGAGSNKFGFVVSTTGSGGYKSVCCPAVDDTNVSLCGTFKTYDMRLYLDGVNVTTRTDVSSFYYSATDAIHVGNGSTINRGFDGKLKLAIAFNRCLAANFVSAISADPLLPFRRRKQTTYFIPPPSYIGGIRKPYLGSGINFWRT